MLTVTEMLRERGVVGKFVEFFGPGLHTLGLADRATIGNMSPEFGSTCAIFPVDRETLRYLEFTGRPTELIELVDAYAREQGLFHTEDSEEPTFSETLELDLSARWSRASRAQSARRTGSRSPSAKAAFLESLREFEPEAAESLGQPATTRPLPGPFRPRIRPGRSTTTIAGSPVGPTFAGGGHRGAAADPVPSRSRTAPRRSSTTAAS